MSTAALLTALVSLAACGGTGHAGQARPGSGEDGAGEVAESSLSGRLVLTGSSTVAPLAGEIGKRFEELHPEVRVDVQTGGSSRGMADARQGLADIGMVSRALKPREDDLIPFTVARDGVAIILHADNPVAALSEEQVRAIYRGEIDDWSELGGPEAEITVVHKAEGRSTLELFLEHFGLANAEVVPDVVIGDNQQGIKTIVGNRHAVGYVSIGAAEHEVERGRPLKLLPMDGVEATVAAVREGRFPLSRQLNLVVAGEPGELARAFLDFALSPAVDDLIAAQYLVPPVR